MNRKLNSLIALVTLVSSLPAMACVSIEKGLQVCPGDTVYSWGFFSLDNFLSGSTVGAANPSKGIVVLQGNPVNSGFNETTYYSGSYTRDLEDLAVKGCLSGICSGDVVYESDYANGATVLAVNPHNGKAVLTPNDVTIFNTTTIYPILLSERVSSLTVTEPNSSRDSERAQSLKLKD